MRLFLLILFVSVFSFQNIAQMHSDLEKYEAPDEFENIHVLKIAEDSLQSTFIIWVKKEVKQHYHQHHTENIVVLEGKAEMLFNDNRVIVKPGDYLNIPKGTKHSVEKVFGKKPLKVLSIQSPNFDGTDRIIL